MAARLPRVRNGSADARRARASEASEAHRAVAPARGMEAATDGGGDDGGGGVDAPPAAALYVGAAVRVCAERGRVEAHAEACVAVGAGGDVLASAFGGGSVEASVMAALAEHGIDRGACAVIRLGPREMLLPGLIDAHVHAPQYAFAGTGTDRALMGPTGWLETYTFPWERACSDDAAGLGRRAFDACVRATLAEGTTCANYFGVLSSAGCCALADACAAAGQRAFVAKVCMDRASPEDYVESAEEGVRGARALAEHCATLPLVHAALAPRFVPTCSKESLEALGALAEELGPACLVHTHVSESLDEVEYVKIVEGNAAARDAPILDAAGLLRPRATVLAHGVHLTDYELRLLAQRECAIAHCPLSNWFFAHGVLRAKRCQRMGVTLCLGTDVAGGYSPSMLNACQHAVAASRAAGFVARAAKDETWNEEEEHLDYAEAFWMATAGGAAALGCARRLGRLEAGFAFDALVVDLSRLEEDVAVVVGSTGTGPQTTGNAQSRFERFVNRGCSSDIAHVFVQGRRVAGRVGTAPDAAGAL